MFCQKRKDAGKGGRNIMQDLSLCLVQADMAFEDWEKNKVVFTRAVSECTAGSVILLPEMFPTGFSMRPEISAQTMDGDAVQWMQAHSSDRVICGSISISENGKYYNRFLWAENGKIKYQYDKKHLFGLGDETHHFTAGSEKIIIEYNSWRIQPFVCYDLRFPIWCRNTQNADLILFSANWPDVRIQAWRTLLPARAVENQCYVAAVNRVGRDNNGWDFNGNSLILDPWGKALAEGGSGAEIMQVKLEKGVLEKFRQDFPVLKDDDTFQVL